MEYHVTIDKFQFGEGNIPWNDLFEYNACASVDASGNVLYDKSRQPIHMKGTYYWDSIDEATIAAFIILKDRGIGKPLIVSGSVPKYSPNPLPEGYAFKVDQVWISEINPQDVDLIMARVYPQSILRGRSDYDIMQHFREIDPKALLSG